MSGGEGGDVCVWPFRGDDLPARGDRFFLVFRGGGGRESLFYFFIFGGGEGLSYRAGDETSDEDGSVRRVKAHVEGLLSAARAGVVAALAHRHLFVVPR